jgi:hypothetical protein
MGRLRRHTIIPGWLGVFALLSGILAGTFGYAPAKQAAPIVDEVLGVLTLCSPDALKDGGHGGAPAHNPAEHCPACITFAKLAIATALVLLAIIAFPLAAVPGPLLAHLPQRATRLSLGGIGSRAPPHFA